MLTLIFFKLIFHLFPRHQDLQGLDGAVLESLTAIPLESYTDAYLSPEQIDRRAEFVAECGSQNEFSIDFNTEGFCKDAMVSLSAHFNNGALDCECNTEGSEGAECAPIGGQCQCKPNVIGQYI